MYKCRQQSQFVKIFAFLKRLNLLTKSSVNNYSSVSKGFQPKFTSKRIQSSSNSNSQADPKFQKDYNAEYKKMKTKLALLEASPRVIGTQRLQPKKQSYGTMALVEDELTLERESCNGEWVDITIRKVNTLLSMDEDTDWKNYLKYEGDGGSLENMVESGGIRWW
ncbi:hypothetical protein Tco_1514603 [Tanacetum coccineum]